MTDRFGKVAWATANSVLPFVLIAVCCGCGSPEQSRLEKQHRLAVGGLRERIESLKSLAASGDLQPQEKRFLIEFELPSDQAALEFLMLSGPAALKEPVVIWATILPAPRKNNEGRQGPPFSHGIDIEWMEVGSRVSGFFFEMNNGDPSGETSVFVAC